MLAAAEFSEAFQAFISTPLDSYEEALANNSAFSKTDRFVEFARRTPAYMSFLHEHGLNPERIFESRDFDQVPATNKQNYISRYPLKDRCLDGRLDHADIMAVSSGTSGVSVMWPRSLRDELRTAFTFEAIFKSSFKADQRRTLALVCFPLGIWIGGLHTISSMRLLRLKGYHITTLAPGTNVIEIRRCLTEIAPLFDQTVIIGYPPFIRDILDETVPSVVDPTRVSLRMLLAGESISESWRDHLSVQLNFESKFTDCISMYGTADAGALGFETEKTIRIRQLCNQSPSMGNTIWNRPDTPALFQYHPDRVLIEDGTDSITIWAEGAHPHFRYDLGDVGTAVGYSQFSEKTDSEVLGGKSLSDIQTASLPFVYQFGRRDHTVSFFGGQVYPEHVASLLDRSDFQKLLTGRFSLLVGHTSTQNKPLTVVVEPHRDAVITNQNQRALAEALEAHLIECNSEYANYVPKKYQLPDVIIAEFHDPRYFERGRKQVYIRKIDE